MTMVKLAYKTRMANQKKPKGLKTYKSVAEAHKDVVKNLEKVHNDVLQSEMSKNVRKR